MNTLSPEKFSQEFKSNQEIIRILEVSKDLSETIFDELPVILIMVDDSKRILKINRQGEKLLNLSEAIALGVDLDRLLPAGGLEAAGKYFEKMNAHDQSLEGISFESEITINAHKRYFHWDLTALSVANMTRSGSTC